MVNINVYNCSNCSYQDECDDEKRNVHIRTEENWCFNHSEIQKQHDKKAGAWSDTTMNEKRREKINDTVVGGFESLPLKIVKTKCQNCEAKEDCVRYFPDFEEMIPSMKCKERVRDATRKEAN